MCVHGNFLLVAATSITSANFEPEIRGARQCKTFQIWMISQLTSARIKELCQQVLCDNIVIFISCVVQILHIPKSVYFFGKNKCKDKIVNLEILLVYNQCCVSLSCQENAMLKYIIKYSEIYCEIQQIFHLSSTSLFRTISISMAPILWYLDYYMKAESILDRSYATCLWWMSWRATSPAY